MVAFGETRCLFGDVRQLDVFASEAERDGWLEADVEPAEDNGGEVGPRRAIAEDAVRESFRDGDGWPLYDWIVLHGAVRPSGLRFRRGYPCAPDWMDLYDYSEQWNASGGVDWTRDVTMVRDGWSRR